MNRKFKKALAVTAAALALAVAASAYTTQPAHSTAAPQLESVREVDYPLCSVLFVEGQVPVANTPGICATETNSLERYTLYPCADGTFMGTGSFTFPGLYRVGQPFVPATAWDDNGVVWQEEEQELFSICDNG